MGRAMAVRGGVPCGRAACLLLAALLAYGAAACRKTPESPIVIGKENDGYAEQALPGDRRRRSMRRSGPCGS